MEPDYSTENSEEEDEDEEDDEKAGLGAVGHGDGNIYEQVDNNPFSCKTYASVLLYEIDFEETMKKNDSRVG